MLIADMAWSLYHECIVPDHIVNNAVPFKFSHIQFLQSYG